MGKQGEDQANVKPDDAANGAGTGGASDEDDDEEDDEEGEPAPTVESLQADLKKMATALKRANTEAKNNRLALKELKEGKKPESDGKKDDQGDTESAKLAREIKVRDAAEALIEAGFNGTVKAARKAVRSFDELDGTGLLDEVDAFKEEFPGMFKRRKRVETPAGGTKGDRRNPDAENGGGGVLSDASRKMLGLTRR